MALQPPRSLADLLDEACAAAGGGPHAADRLRRVLKAHHLWPTIEVRRFAAPSTLALLHTTHKKRHPVVAAADDGLHAECRSVVVDLDAATPAERVVAALEHGAMERMSDGQYQVLADPSRDACFEAFDGTSLMVFHDRGFWHVTTAACTTADVSRFFGAKSHGAMFDEALAAGVGAATTRADFCAAHLDPARAYTFVLVHHENRSPTRGPDYTPTFGAGYAVLVHIATRDRRTGADVHAATPLVPGTVRPREYATPLAAVRALAQGTDGCGAGFVVKRAGRTAFWVSSAQAVAGAERDAGHVRPWQNALWVYMQNQPHYRVQDWAEEHMAPEDIIEAVDSTGALLSPGYALHAVFCHMRDVLHDLYRLTTTYFVQLRRFRMDKAGDAALPGILRFHLAQLRHLQVAHHAHAVLTRRAIYHYLCHHLTLKNARLLIAFFAGLHEGSAPSWLARAAPTRTRDCFRLLARGLARAPLP